MSSSPEHHTADVGTVERIRASFERQTLMRMIGATLVEVRPGRVVIDLPFRADLTQQHGFLHAAVVTAIVDSACGYAALSLMPAGAEVLSVEFKVNLLAPAAGESFRAEARVLRSGRTLSVCAGDVYALTGEQRKHIAVMQATMISAIDSATSP
jgi:uncharacterized protein (TIGR00369 family)